MRFINKLCISRCHVIKKNVSEEYLVMGGRGGRAPHYILNIKFKDKNNVYAYGMFKTYTSNLQNFYNSLSTSQRM